MSDRDTWKEDARTDRAIELLRVLSAKTDASGRVVPAHRYSRDFKYVAERLCGLTKWGLQSETVTMESLLDSGARPVVTVSINVVTADGTEWTQEGSAGPDDDKSYDWYALAACRALLNYCRANGDPMTPDEVIAMLEEDRARLTRLA